MKKMKFSSQQKETRRRIIELSYQLKISHLGSCLSAVDIIEAVYQAKKKEERFVLSGGHAAIALYVILEKYKIMDSSVIRELHIHPDRNIDLGIYV
jgi:transketolase N-terminal domain/subunit